jgi:hypothetical protein
MLLAEGDDDHLKISRDLKTRYHAFDDGQNTRRVYDYLAGTS